MGGSRRGVPHPRQPGAFHLILASGSPRRRQLLRRLGFAFDQQPAEGVDEAAVGGSAREIVTRLATLKAATVLEHLARGAPRRATAHRVLGADTVVALGAGGDERILGKPKDAAEARSMLAALAGRSHRVLTGLAVCRLDRQPRTAVETTEVWFRELTRAEIHRYVVSGEPLDKAGAYGIQGRGSILVTAIDGCFYNVVGLPLTLTATLLGGPLGPDAELCDCRSHPLQRGSPACDQ